MSTGENPEGLPSLSDEAREMPETIDRLRRYYGLSVTKLGRSFGMSRQLMSNRLQGRTGLDAGEVKAFAKFFGVPTDVLYLSPDEAAAWVATHPKDRPDWLTAGSQTPRMYDMEPNDTNVSLVSSLVAG